MQQLLEAFHLPMAVFAGTVSGGGLEQQFDTKETASQDLSGAEAELADDGNQFCLRCNKAKGFK
eukprot:12144537-Prorocentrum_lima.AAC.1